MRKISCLVNTSVFQAQILTEVITMLLNKCESLLKLIQTCAEEDSSPVGYFKWIVNSDHLAHEVLYDFNLELRKAIDTDDFGDAKTLGDIYKCVRIYVSVEIFSEDYIRTLILRYNHDKSDKNRHKLETQ